MENSLKDSLNTRNPEPGRLGRLAVPDQKESKMVRFMLKGYVHSTRIGIETVAWVVDMRTTEILSLENESQASSVLERGQSFGEIPQRFSAGEGQNHSERGRGICIGHGTGISG